MKIVLGTIAAALIATATFASSAEAACRWDGYAWRCWQGPHHQYWRHDFRDRGFHRDFHRDWRGDRDWHGDRDRHRGW